MKELQRHAGQNAANFATVCGVGGGNHRKSAVSGSTTFALPLGVPRPPRVHIPGLTQHVVQRGNNRIDIFHSPSDYECFLLAVREAGLRFGLKIHAYALMTNHIHLMVTPPHPTALPNAMQLIGGRYVPYFNQRYERTGGLFEGRYRSVPVGTESHWVTCMRYIELNPVRAGLVDNPRAYRWTSYHAHALESPDPLITEHPLYLRFGCTAADRARNWRAFCGQQVPDAEISEIREAVRRSRLRHPVVLP